MNRILNIFLFGVIVSIGLLPANTAAAAGYTTLETEHFDLLFQGEAQADLGPVAEEVWSEVSGKDAEFANKYKGFLKGKKLKILFVANPGQFNSMIEQAGKKNNLPQEKIDKSKKDGGALGNDVVLINVEGKSTDAFDSLLKKWLGQWLDRLAGAKKKGPIVSGKPPEQLLKLFSSRAESDHFVMHSQSPEDQELLKHLEKVWEEVASRITTLDEDFEAGRIGGKVQIYFFTKPGAYKGLFQNAVKNGSMSKEAAERAANLISRPMFGGLAVNAEKRKPETMYGTLSHIVGGHLLRIQLAQDKVALPEWLLVAFSYAIEFSLHDRPSIKYVGYREDSVERVYTKTETFGDENWADALRERVKNGSSMSIYSACNQTIGELTPERVAFLYSLGSYMTRNSTNIKKFNAYLKSKGESPDERDAILILKAYDTTDEKFNKKWMSFVKSRSFK